MRKAMRLSMVLLMALASLTLNGCMLLGGGLGAGVGGGGGPLLGSGALNPLGGLARGRTTPATPAAPDDRRAPGADAGEGIVTAGTGGTGGITQGATGGLTDPITGGLDDSCSS